MDAPFSLGALLLQHGLDTILRGGPAEEMSDVVAVVRAPHPPLSASPHCAKVGPKMCDGGIRGLWPSRKMGPCQPQVASRECMLLLQVRAELQPPARFTRALRGVSWCRVRSSLLPGHNVSDLVLFTSTLRDETSSVYTLNVIAVFDIVGVDLGAFVVNSRRAACDDAYPVTLHLVKCSEGLGVSPHPNLITVPIRRQGGVICHCRKKNPQEPTP